MSNNGKKATNTDNFNEMMRRSSSRLRGGSVPPPDSESIVPTVDSTTIRGRGRGRGTGRGVVSLSTRNASLAKQAKVVTPVVTLTVPDAEETAPSNSPTNDAPTDPSSDTSTIQPSSGTSVIHSVGLISRDDVRALPNRKPRNQKFSPTTGDTA